MTVALIWKRHRGTILVALGLIALSVLTTVNIMVRGMPAIVTLGAITAIGIPAVTIAFVAEHRRFRRDHGDGIPRQRQLAAQIGYRLVILNDDRTHALFVVRLLKNCFGLESGEAAATTLYIHRRGVGICAVFDTEEEARSKLAEAQEFVRSYAYPLAIEIRKSPSEESVPTKIEKPKCTVALSKRVMLFQSPRQFFYVVIIILVINLILDALMPFRSALPRIGVGVGSCVFVIYYLWRIFPHEMFISTTSVDNVQDDVEESLKRIMKESARTPTQIHYGENLPDFLAWREARVTLTLLPGAIRIIGPGITLSWLYRRLHRRA
jgi:ATP-dependent Clp protease adapter protein ClpS